MSAYRVLATPMGGYKIEEPSKASRVQRLCARCGAPKITAIPDPVYLCSDCKSSDPQYARMVGAA